MNVLFLVTPLVALVIALVYTYFGVWHKKSEREAKQLSKTKSVVVALRQERLKESQESSKQKSTKRTLSDVDLQELSSFFASQPLVSRTVNDVFVAANFGSKPKKFEEVLARMRPENLSAQSVAVNEIIQRASSRGKAQRPTKPLKFQEIKR